MYCHSLHNNLPPISLKLKPGIGVQYLALLLQQTIKDGSAEMLETCFDIQDELHKRLYKESLKSILRFPRGTLINVQETGPQSWKIAGTTEAAYHPKYTYTFDIYLVDEEVRCHWVPLPKNVVRLTEIAGKPVDWVYTDNKYVYLYSVVWWNTRFVQKEHGRLTTIGEYLSGQLHLKCTREDCDTFLDEQSLANFEYVLEAICQKCLTKEIREQKKELCEWIKNEASDAAIEEMLAIKHSNE